MRVWTIERTQRRALLGFGGLVFALGAGCSSFPSVPKLISERPANADVNLVQVGYLENTPANIGAADPSWAVAEKLYIDQDYGKAEKKFHEVADNTKNPPLLAEKARFFEAECLRMEGHFPKSADTFAKMLNDFPSGVYREKAVALMFQIANYWLDDTREEIEGSRKASFWSLNSNYIHVSERSKPFLDQEGRALDVLTKVHVHDPTGPYSDKALYLIGYVNFYRSNFKEADLAFTQLVEMHDRSPLRAKAAEMAIMAKNNTTGGSEYDGQKTADALRLVQQAKNTIPELVRDRGDFLDRQIVAIRTQQAEKDFHQLVKNDATLLVKGKQDRIVNKDLTEQIDGDVKVKIGKDSATEVVGKHSLKATGDMMTESGATISLKSAANMDVKVGANLGVDAAAAVHIKAGATVVIEAAAMITLKVGGSSVVLSPANVSIVGPMVMINSGGSAGAGAGASPKPVLAVAKPVEKKDPLA